MIEIRAFETGKNWDRLKESIGPAIDSGWWNSTRFAISKGRMEEGQNILRRVALAITRQQLAIAAIALKRYQLRHGALPEKLGELVPEFLAEVPHDWMNGQPLRYQRREGGKFLLYSVGLDGVDDGGNPLPADAKKKPQFLDGRDLVWPQVAGSGIAASAGKY